MNRDTPKERGLSPILGVSRKRPFPRHFVLNDNDFSQSFKFALKHFKIKITFNLRDHLLQPLIFPFSDGTTLSLLNRKLTLQKIGQH